jgi:hypothetical protein
MGQVELISEAVESQCSIYAMMYEVGRRQCFCVENQDFTGLNESFSEMHQLMERARTAQGRLTESCRMSEQYPEHFSRMKNWLERLQLQRRGTQEKAEQLLEKNRAENRQIIQGRKALRSYGFSQSEPAKLFDGIR